MKLLAPVLAGALLLTGTAATAQTATDAQCILLSNAFATQGKDEQAKRAAEAAMYFYLGRVRDGVTTPQLKALFEGASKGLSEANAPQKMSECVGALQTKVRLLDSMNPRQGQPGAAQPRAAQPQPKKPDGR